VRCVKDYGMMVIYLLRSSRFALTMNENANYKHDDMIRIIS
jgi:hypothetical protein